MKDKVVEVVEKPKPSVMPALYSGDSWELKDQRARGILIEHLNDRPVLELQGLTTAKEMYDKIVDIHQNTNIGVNAFYTFAGMLNLKWDGDHSTLDNHIAAIKSGDAKLSGNEETHRRRVPRLPTPQFAPGRLDMGNFSNHHIKLNPK